MVAACCNRATPAAGRAARAVLPDPHGRTPIQKVVGGFCLDSRYPNLVWLRQNSEPCDIPGRDTAPGFLLRLWCADFDMPNLVAKDHGTPRRLLRFCNVGSFPQNEPMTCGGLAKRPRDPLMSPRKCCRCNGLVAFCRAFGRACGGEPGIGATARSRFDVASVAPFCPNRSGADKRVPPRPDRRAAGARSAMKTPTMRSRTGS